MSQTLNGYLSFSGESANPIKNVYALSLTIRSITHRALRG